MVSIHIYIHAIHIHVILSIRLPHLTNVYKTCIYTYILYYIVTNLRILYIIYMIYYRDLKEKTKKQETALKDTKELVTTHFNELISLKSTCIQRDEEVNDVLNECLVLIRSQSNEISSFIEVEQALKSQITTLTELNKAQEVTIHSLTSEHEPRTQELVSLRHANTALQAQVSELQQQRDEAQEGYERVQAENDSIQRSYSANVAEAKDMFEKVRILYMHTILSHYHMLSISLCMQY